MNSNPSQPIKIAALGLLALMAAPFQAIAAPGAQGAPRKSGAPARVYLPQAPLGVPQAGGELSGLLRAAKDVRLNMERNLLRSWGIVHDIDDLVSRIALGGSAVPKEDWSEVLSRVRQAHQALGDMASYAKFAAALDEELSRLQRGVSELPEMGKAPDSEVRGSGVKLEDAMTGGNSITASGAPEAVPSAGADQSHQDQPMIDHQTIEENVAWAHGTVQNILREVHRVIVGLDGPIEAIMMALIAGEPVLLEGLPGVAKTETAKAFADAVDASFKRIQGTPDKLPSDIIGAEILQEDPATGKKEFLFKPGPVFADIVLADEINRNTPKAQSALLEAMAEKRVTVGNQTHELSKSFTLLATENPVEQDGTYRLPEAQLDRFMFKILVPQPSARELKAIMDLNESRETRPRASKVTNLEELGRIRRIATQVRLDESLKDYIVQIAMGATQHVAPELQKVQESVEYSVYVRAAIFMARAARIHALLQGRDYVMPYDIKAVAPMVLRHRIVLNYQAGKDQTPDTVIQKILDVTPIPREWKERE